MIHGDILGAESVPSHQVPVSHWVKLYRPTKQQSLLSEVDDFFAGEIQRPTLGLDIDVVDELGNTAPTGSRYAIPQTAPAGPPSGFLAEPVPR